jgi:hypothetical protein
MMNAPRKTAFDLFRSIVLLLEVNREGDDFTISSDLLSNWICQYDDWWKTSAGITKGENLHLLYGRGVSGFGSGILPLTTNLEKIVGASSQRGYAFLLRVDIDEAVLNSDCLLRLAESGARTIVVDARDSARSGTVDRARRHVVEALVERKVSVALLGPISFWKNEGLIGSPILDATNFQIIPATGKAEIQAILQRSKTADRKTVVPEAPDDFVGAPGTYFDPCSRRFQLYVAPDGRLYPCNGLVGVDRYTLGTIHQRVEDTVLGSSSDRLDDLQKLATAGPQISTDATLHDFSELPVICAAHRQWLERHSSVTSQAAPG